MAYQINDNCVACGVCANDCPVSAIYEDDGKYTIAADICTDCGTCADSCPVDAPHQV